MRKQPKEWTFLESVRKIIHRSHPNVRVGWGDDAFVFRNFPGYSVLCQDMMVEDIHFDLSYMEAPDLGHKSLAACLSDLAAMGATPRFVHVSLALPKKINESWLDRFYQSMAALADETGCQIVGGDLTASPDRLVIDVNVHGSCEAEPLTLGRAQPGDLILCSGPLGLSKVGLWALQENRAGFESSKKAHLRPKARLDLKEELQSKRSFIKGVTDCSDGFLQDIFSFLDVSKYGALLLADQILFHDEVVQFARITNQSPSDVALIGGEDYELLILIHPSDLAHFKDWQLLAQITETENIFIMEKGQPRIAPGLTGFEHF